MSTTEVEPLLTMSGVRAEVMRRSWQEVQAHVGSGGSTGRDITNEEFARIVKAKWTQVKREIAALKEKDKLAKLVETTVAKEAQELELA